MTNEPKATEEAAGPLSPYAHAALKAMLDQAVQLSEELEDDREKAMEYYRGEKPEAPEPGRSRFRSTDVRDTIQATLPAIMRFFCGSERAVEARPRSAAQTALAEEQTAYAQHVLFVDNPGYRILHDAVVNALRERIGPVKVWHDETEKRTVTQRTGLTMDELLALSEDSAVELRNVESELTDEEIASGDLAQTFSATVIHTERAGRVAVAALPPEEFIWTPASRSLEEAPLVAHRREVTVSDLLAMGYDYDKIRDHIGPGREVSDVIEHERHEEGDEYASDLQYQTASRRVLYTEAYVYLDAEGTAEKPSEARLHRVCCVGGAYAVLHAEEISHRPFALFLPILEPHSLECPSLADWQFDVQDVKSQIMRAQLDSLGMSLNPRTVVLQDGVESMEDVLNQELGAVIRERIPEAVRVLEHRFVGADAFPMLEYMDAVTEQRTGKSRAAQGLDADSLQSATKMAVAATVTGARQRVEMIARTLAETGLKPLMRLILQTARLHPNTDRVVRLRGAFLPVNPAHWDVDLDFEVVVGLGAGMVEERVAVLDAIAERQLAAIQAFGPINPLTSISKLRNTLARIANIAGYPNADEFWNTPDEQMIAQQMLQQAQEGQKAPAPEQALAMAQIEVEKMKTERELAIKARELELKEREMAMTHEREIAKMQMDAELKRAEIEAKYAVEVQLAGLKAEVERERTATQAATEAERLSQNKEIEAARLATQAEIASEKSESETPKEGE